MALKAVQTEPVIQQVLVTIEGVVYKKHIHTIEVTCDLNGYVIMAETEQHSGFIMGSSFWDENFGKRQANRIRKLCAQAVAEFKKKEGIK